MLNAPIDNREFEKVLVSALENGSPLIIFDNVDITLSSSALARALTSKIFSGRLLGKSKILNLPVETTFLCNGNNICLEGDISRRCYWIRLDSKASKPWLRDGFKHPELCVWTAENRDELLRCLFTMVLAWIEGGKHTGKAMNIGRFEKWCSTVGGILTFAKVDGFLTNLMEMYDRHSKKASEWEVFLYEWLDQYGGTPKLVSEIYPNLKHFDELAPFGESLPEDLKVDLGEKDQSAFNRTFGKAIERIEDQRFGDEKITITRFNKDLHHGAYRWRVIKDLDQNRKPVQSTIC
jgi:hypothetical protein